jgi:hypothetical protein
MGPGDQSSGEVATVSRGHPLDNLEEFPQGTDIHIGATDVDKGRKMKAKGDEICQRKGIPLFTSGAVGMGMVMVNHRPGGMAPVEFWAKLQAKKSGGKLLPAYLSDQFSAPLMSRLVASLETGHLATCSIGASLAGTFLAGEIMVHLLQDTSLANRQAHLAHKLTVFDFALAHYQVMDVNVD